MTKARSLVDVVLGEAAYGSPAKRYADMKAIASVISNRARALGVTPEQVVSNRREFNAYGKSLPKGASAYRSLAQRALDDVSTNGPVHNGMFYATPKAAGNLPSGLKQEAVTSGHVYYSDPKNRAIGTSLGYRQPKPAETAQQAITNIMTPQAQPATVNERMGILNAYTPPQEAQQMAQVPTRAVQTTSYTRPEPQASLDTLRQPQPAMSLAQQYASYGAGKQPQQIDGLLSPVQRQLIDGLNAQKTQLAAGVNPMDAAEPWKQPTLLDQPVAQQPMPAVDVPQVDPQPTASVADPGMLSAPRDPVADRALARRVNMGLGASKLAGGFGGGLLGGLLLGPVGALAGGLLGRNVGARSYYPPAPTATPGQQQSDRISRDSLNDYGRSVNDSSRQFRDAVSKGSVGLY
jgi:hypothetical protein